MSIHNRLKAFSYGYEFKLRERAMQVKADKPVEDVKEEPINDN